MTRVSSGHVTHRIKGSVIALLGLAVLLSVAGCPDASPPETVDQPQVAGELSPPVVAVPATPAPLPQRDCRVVHVFVALCDNEHQGIVPVPAALGNGQDPRNNLYWGAMYGARTFFSRSQHWQLGKREIPTDVAAVRERVVFTGAGPGQRVFVIAEAYDGAQMAAALTDFFAAAAGTLSRQVVINSDNQSMRIDAGGAADLVCFVGHNGLMDAPLTSYPTRRGDAGPKQAVVLACKSRAYFQGPLRQAGCQALVTTTGLMAPEAYTLDAIIRSWAAGDEAVATRRQAADAYAKYQKISQPAALSLFAGPDPE